jgi:hypothetical protein
VEIFITQLTSDGVLEPVEPNVLRIRDNNVYLNDVITANITITSALKRWFLPKRKSIGE